MQDLNSLLKAINYTNKRNRRENVDNENNSCSLFWCSHTHHEKSFWCLPPFLQIVRSSLFKLRHITKANCKLIKIYWSTYFIFHILKLDYTFFNFFPVCIINFITNNLRHLCKRVKKKKNQKKIHVTLWDISAIIFLHVFKKREVGKLKRIPNTCYSAWKKKADCEFIMVCCCVDRNMRIKNLVWKINIFRSLKNMRGAIWRFEGIRSIEKVTWDFA